MQKTISYQRQMRRAEKARLIFLSGREVPEKNGDSFFVHREAASFEQASGNVIDELSEKIDEQTRKRSDPPG